jgi:membrane protein involved in colicin uptake
MDEYYKALGAYGDGGITMPKTVTPPTVTGCPTGSTMINGKCTPIATNPKTQDPAASAASAADAAKAAADAKAAASAASARAYAAAKAAGDSDAAAKAAAGVNPSALAASESGAIGAASIAAQLKAAEIAQRAADIAAAQATQLANFRAKEAADAAAAAARTQLDVDERSKFRAMQDAFNSSIPDKPTGKFNTPTLDGAKGLMGSNSGGTQNIYVTVQGTVTGEQDLVQTIRNGLLRGQYNGQSTVLEAI